MLLLAFHYSLLISPFGILFISATPKDINYLERSDRYIYIAKE
jgi:hypothetical protein